MILVYFVEREVFKLNLCLPTFSAPLHMRPSVSTREHSAGGLSTADFYRYKGFQNSLLVTCQPGEMYSY